MSELKRINVAQKEMLENLLKDYSEVLTQWELEFVNTILHFKKMSPKQREVVRNIFSSL